MPTEKPVIEVSINTTLKGCHQTKTLLKDLTRNAGRALQVDKHTGAGKAASPAAHFMLIWVWLPFPIPSRQWLGRAALGASRALGSARAVRGCSLLSSELGVETVLPRGVLTWIAAPRGATRAQRLSSNGFRSLRAALGLLMRLESIRAACQLPAGGSWAAASLEIEREPLQVTGGSRKAFGEVFG